MTTETNLVDEIKKASDAGRYFLLVVSEDRMDVGSISLRLDGSETTEVAVKRFETALCVAAMELANRENYFPCGPHIDRKPRTEYEIAAANFVRKIGGGVFPDAEYAAMIAAKTKEYEASVNGGL